MSSDVYNEPRSSSAASRSSPTSSSSAPRCPSNNTGAYYYEGRDAVSAAITQIIGGTDPAAALSEAQADVEFAME